MTTFDPTPAATPQTWLTLADRLQLERELADLPTLADLLERNYDALLARGDRDPDDSAVRYVTRFDVLDLADRRVKWERSASRTEPLTLADRGAPGPNVDPAFWAEMGRQLGAQRMGILPTLVSWVGDFAGSIPTLRYPPTDPARVMWICWPNGDVLPMTGWEPTIERECRWLLAHLDDIVACQQITVFRDWLHGVITSLDALGISLAGPHEHACLSAEELAELYPVSRSTVYRWWNEGHLSDVGKVDRRRVFVVHEVRQLIDHPPRVEEGLNA